MKLDIVRGEWEGHEMLNFTVGGRQSFIVCPKKPRPDKAWVWRAEFFGAFDYADRALLERGWYLAYHGVSNMYGCPESIAMMREFYLAVDEGLCLNSRPSVFGFSRGGLYTANFANAYPESVSSIYLDAPVTDLRSWPADLYGDGSVAEGCKKEAMDWYHIANDEEFLAFTGSPNYIAADLAKKKVPTIVVAGAADRTVPWHRNGEIFARNFREGDPETPLKVIVKAGCDHHPHSLTDPTEIVEFVERFMK